MSRGKARYLQLQYLRSIIFGAGAKMSELIDEVDDLWDITLDIARFYHECCYNCQPREDGEYVWLSHRHDLGDVLEDILMRVCEVNGHTLQTEITYSTLEDALRENPFVCPNCGTDHTEPSNEIGDEWLRLQGQNTESATYLVTRTFWPYFTHYTKIDEHYRSGLERLTAILADGVIHGTLRTIEGSRPAVCLTECSPLEIMEMLNVMRLSIDELPYGRREIEWNRSKHGIAIKRDSLIQYGARPVIHAESTIRTRLGEEELWRFQLFDPNVGHQDWTFEREFRVPNEIRLADLESTDIVLIVENRAEQFTLLAKRDVPIYAILPFDYVYSSDDPYPHRSDRQKNKDAERFL
jgi:hypothetical protein